MRYTPEVGKEVLAEFVQNFLQQNNAYSVYDIFSKAKVNSYQLYIQNIPGNVNNYVIFVSEVQAIDFWLQYLLLFVALRESSLKNDEPKCLMYLKVLYKLEPYLEQRAKEVSKPIFWKIIIMLTLTTDSDPSRCAYQMDVIKKVLNLVYTPNEVLCLAYIGKHLCHHQPTV